MKWVYTIYGLIKEIWSINHDEIKNRITDIYIYI